jgi:hypothetical protein
LGSWYEHVECKATFKAEASLKEIYSIISKWSELCKNSLRLGKLEGREKASVAVAEK